MHPNPRHRSPVSLANACLAATLALTVVLAGCNHYAITDPSTDKTYFTNKYRLKDGALQFKDAKTGRRVTIQNSEIGKVTADQYRQAIAE